MDFVVRSQIIWAKPRFVLSRGDYHWQHEPCLYVVRKGATGQWQGARDQATLWAVGAGGEEDVATVHGTQKPVELMPRPITNNSCPGDAICEPLGGSGTTIIAAELTGRRCLALEIDPRYVDVMFLRWRQMTGHTAVLDGDARSFAQIGAARAGAGGPTLVSSQRDAARRLGVSHAALQKAQASGRITAEPDGRWDIDKLCGQLAASSDPARKTASSAPDAANATDSGKLHSPPPTSTTPPPPPEPPATATSFPNARTANEVLKAQERKLRLEERRGQLVDKARAKLLVHRLAREERDALMAWPARIAAEMAAALGADPHRLPLLLEARPREHLAERAGIEIAVS